MVTLTDNEQFTYTLQEVDKKGQPIPGAPTFDAPPIWASDNVAVAAVTLNADGVSGDVVAGIPGTATISVTAAIGGAAIGGVDQVTVGLSAPTTLNLTAGTVSEQGATGGAAPKK